MSSNAMEDSAEDIKDHRHRISNRSCLGLPIAMAVLLDNSQTVLPVEREDPNFNKVCHESSDNNCLELPCVNINSTVQDHQNNTAKSNAPECTLRKNYQFSQNVGASSVNDNPLLNDWISDKVPDSELLCNDSLQGDPSDEEDDSLGTENSWSMDSAPGSHCSSLMDINHPETTNYASSFLIPRNDVRLNNAANSYPNDDVSLSSHLSDSLSSISLQDGSSLTTTSSAYFSGSTISQNDATCNTFEKLEVSTSKAFLGFLHPSLFAHCPPTINFLLPEQIQEKDGLSEDAKKIMKWQLTKTTPVILKRILLSSGFRFTRKLNNWIGTWGKHMKAFEFQNLRDYQKVNHYPGTFQIGRKDRLWKNICRMQQVHSKQEFGFVPTTYVIPGDLRKLWLAWNSYGNKPRWIVKPPAAARGRGIHVIHKFGQLPKQGTFIVQRYIARPYLINGSKFDLRIYVYIPSFNPLRIYLYDDGLVRFASVKYSNSVQSLRNQFMHLTNSSVNKVHEAYTISSDGNSYDGHKWSLKALWSYLSQRGINTSEIWDSISDIIIKTIISCEPCVNILTHGYVRNRYNCHEVFGFDIMLDAFLKPWLLEVNVSPSLHSSSQLDVSVKGKMLTELLNLSGFKLPSHLPAVAREELAASLQIEPEFVTLDLKLLDSGLSDEEKVKQRMYAVHEREKYIHDILKNLSPKDVFHLCESEDELSRAKHFQRIFPSQLTYKYHKFFCNPQYYTNLLDAWEAKYHNDRDAGHQVLFELSEQKIHLLNVPTQTKQDVIQPTRFKKSSFVCSLNRTCRSNPRHRWLQRTRSSVFSAVKKPRCGRRAQKK